MLKEKFVLVKGFTLLEILIVIALFGIVVGLSIPFYQSFQVSNQLDTTTFEIVQALRRAQASTMAGEDNQIFGVHFESQKFVLFRGFRGDIYLPNDQYNEINEIPKTLTISTSFGQNISFSKIKGEVSLPPPPIPAFPWKITLHSTTNESKIIQINAKGTIDQL